MYGATCAATLSLPIDNYEIGTIVKADSWFGNEDIHCFNRMWWNYINASGRSLQTISKGVPRYTWFGDRKVGCSTANLGGVDFQALGFQDIKKKQFISNCSTILLGNSMKTKYQSDVSHP